MPKKKASKERKPRPQPIMTLQQHLEKIGACREARNWAGERTAAQAWNQCPHHSWLWWWMQCAQICDPVKVAEIAIAACRMVLILYPLMKTKKRVSELLKWFEYALLYDLDVDDAGSLHGACVSTQDAIDAEESHTLGSRDCLEYLIRFIRELTCQAAYYPKRAYSFDRTLRKMAATPGGLWSVFQSLEQAGHDAYRHGDDNGDDKHKAHKRYTALVKRTYGPPWLEPGNRDKHYNTRMVRVRLKQEG